MSNISPDPTPPISASTPEEFEGLLAKADQQESDVADRVGTQNSEDQLALRFTDQHGEDIRYTAAWGRWSVWDGKVWRTDDTLDVFDLARKVCRAEAANCSEKSRAFRIASAQTVSAVERLARSDRRHAMTVDQWDSDPWLLCTPGGIVDLRTGELRPARRTDYCSKVTAVAPHDVGMMRGRPMAQAGQGIIFDIDGPYAMPTIIQCPYCKRRYELETA